MVVLQASARGEENTVADKTSVISQRIPAIGVALLAAVWSLSFIATVNGQSPHGTPPGTWTMKAPLPAPRAEVAAAAFDGKLHAIGGSVSGTAGPYHDEYDPAADLWRPQRARCPRDARSSRRRGGGRQDLRLRRLRRLGARGAGTGAF